MMIGPRNHQAQGDEEPVVTVQRIGGWWRFDQVAVRHALTSVGLLGSAEDAIVAIGDLSRHPDVQLGESVIRRLCNDGTIRVTGSIGGKRRFRLSEAVADVAAARSLGRFR